MMKSLDGRGVTGAIEFCDACGTVCDERCRTDAVLRVAREKVAALGPRP